MSVGSPGAQLTGGSSGPFTVYETYKEGKLALGGTGVNMGVWELIAYPFP